jgi:hypothetical protein
MELLAGEGAGWAGGRQEIEPFVLPWQAAEGSRQEKSLPRQEVLPGEYGWAEKQYGGGGSNKLGGGAVVEGDGEDGHRETYVHKK